MYRVDPGCNFFPQLSYILFMSAQFPDPLKITPAESISFMSADSSSFLQLFFLDISIDLYQSFYMTTHLYYWGPLILLCLRR